MLASFDVSGNIMLSSILVEALAACDAIEPMSTLDQIRAQIEAVLAEPDNPLAWSMAASIFYSQFEQEDVVGPYFEAVAELDDRPKLQLCVMARRAELSDNFAAQPGWLLREIADRAEMTDEAGREVLREAATTVADSWMPQETVHAHLEGLRGWARIAEALPDPGGSDSDIGRRTWRLVDELIFRLDRDDPATGDEAARCWQELLGRCAPAAIDVLFMIRSAHALGHLPIAAASRTSG